MKVGRRNVLKMLGLSPGLLVPWTPASQQPATPPATDPPAVPEYRIVVEVKPVDMEPLQAARAYATTACMGRFSLMEDSRS
jgi:hypothetical protein